MKNNPLNRKIKDIKPKPNTWEYSAGLNGIIKFFKEEKILFENNIKYSPVTNEYNHELIYSCFSWPSKWKKGVKGSPQII